MRRSCRSQERLRADSCALLSDKSNFFRGGPASYVKPTESLLLWRDTISKEAEQVVSTYRSPLNCLLDEFFEFHFVHRDWRNFEFRFPRHAQNSSFGSAAARSIFRSKRNPRRCCRYIR